MLIDTHAHLWWESYRDDLDKVIERARAAGVEKMIVPGTDLLTSKQAVELARKYPGIIYAAVGIHPEETIEKRLAVTRNAMMFNSQISKLRELISENREVIAAVGEIGTDGNTEELREKMSEQKELFREQLEIATEFDLPVIVHTRKSLTETLEVIDYMNIKPRGQFHCFSYDEESLQEVLKRDFYVSFCGNITWSKRVRELVARVPENRLLLETDSPLLIPRDEKGEPIEDSLRNEPKNVRMLASLQAELRKVSPEELEKQTSENTKRLYKIDL